MAKKERKEALGILFESVGLINEGLHPLQALETKDALDEKTIKDIEQILLRIATACRVHPEVDEVSKEIDEEDLY